jgi:hypothetical protein
MKEIPLTQGKVALVDDDDFELVSKYRWHINSGRYAIGRVGGPKKIMMHRLIMNAPIECDVDHINGNGFDNRRANLRFCTHAQNMDNCRKQKNGTTSNYIGVCRQGKKWRGQVMHRGVVYYGFFDSETQAAVFRDVVAVSLKGEFSSLNFPDRRLEFADV